MVKQLGSSEEDSYTPYQQAFSKGQVTLPAIADTQYHLLLAEKGGKPSAQPDLPTGISERPQTNQSCPTWLHDSWLAQAADGNMYKTWHPQIDPVYWCYYRHEHGSDPGLAGYSPVFDYVAYYNNRQNEKHEGFKGFAFHQDNVAWYINVHATTGLLARVCVRFHTVVFSATDTNTGEKLLELSFKGDYGGLTVAGINEDSIQPNLANCPNQAAIMQEIDFSKAVRVANDTESYEGWFGGVHHELGMRFEDSGMLVDIQNPLTACNTHTCSTAIVQEGNAEVRGLEFFDLSFNYVTSLDASDGNSHDGYFYTDPYGIVQQDSSKNTLRQFINPGFNATLNGHYGSYDAWQAWYHNTESMNMELEDALGTMN